MAQGNFHFSFEDLSRSGFQETRTLNHYEVLELPVICSLECIRRNYKKFALQLHPDKNPHDPEGAEKAFKNVNEAFSVLSDPVKRAEYDLLLSRKSKSSTLQPSRHNEGNIFTDSKKFTHHENFGAFDCEQDTYPSFNEAKESFETFYHKSFSDSNCQKYRTYSKVFSQANESSNFSFCSKAEEKLNNNRNKYQIRKRQRFKSFDYGSVPKRDDLYASEYFRNKIYGPDDTFSSLVYLLPLMFIIFILVLNASINNESLFSFTQDYHYSKMRTTNNRKIHYYVAENFADKVEGGDIREFEKHVEIVYKNHLQSLCDSESEFRESNIIKAKYFKNWDLLFEMEKLPMPNCLLLFEVFKV